MPNMTTGSDTRMYNPRSEAARSYTGDDEEDYQVGHPDPEELEQRRDKRQDDKEAEKTKDLPHIRVEVDEKPMGGEALPALPPDDMEEPVMGEDENAVGAEVSQLTGMPGSMGAQLDTATGARTGTGSALGGYRPLLATSYPMDNAWSELLKREKNPWQPQSPDFEGPPGGRQPHTATPRGSKHKSRVLSRYGSGGGLDELGDEHMAVGRSHLGISRIHPMAQSDPAEYARFKGQQAGRKIRQNIALPFSPEGTYGQRGLTAGPTGAGNIRGLAGQAGKKHAITAVQQPTMRGEPKVSPNMFKSELEDLSGLLKKTDLKTLLAQTKSPENYLHFSQMRAMLRRIKDMMERNEKRLKAASLHPKQGEGGHRDGGTTEPTGGTESLDPQDDTKNWGAPAHILVGRGSGRVA